MFDRIGSEDPVVLILGSMPSQTSIKQHQYYAHPQNAFWWIMEQILLTDEACCANETWNGNTTASNSKANSRYTARKKLIAQHRICVWDVLRSASRRGSLDANIQTGSEQFNDLVSLLKSASHLSLIACNGAKSHQLLKRCVAKEVLREFHVARLPSTSPAHAAKSREQKLFEWREIISPHVSLVQTKPTLLSSTNPV